MSAGQDPRTEEHLREEGRLPPDIIRAAEEPYSVRADLAFEACLFGKTWTGKGSYVEMRSGPIPRSRLEILSELSGNPSRFLQVCDGNKTYIHDAIENAARVIVLDTVRCHEAMELPETVRNRGPRTCLGLGGIAGLLRHLESAFQFGPSKPVEYQTRPHQQIVGALRRWVVTRHLPEKTERFPPSNEMAGTTAADWARLPSRIPTHVVLTFAAASPLPVSIVYVRLPPGTSESRTLLRLSLTGIRINPPISEEEFRFVIPEGVEMVDRTSEFLGAP